MLCGWLVLFCQIRPGVARTVVVGVIVDENGPVRHRGRTRHRDARAQTARDDYAQSCRRRRDGAWFERRAGGWGWLWATKVAPLLFHHAVVSAHTVGPMVWLLHFICGDVVPLLPWYRVLYMHVRACVCVCV